MRINPGVTGIQPNGKMAVLTPCRSSGLDDLLCGVRRQIFTRRGELEIWFVCDVANELFQENWSFEPPMPEHFRIERSDNDRVKTEFADFSNLLTALSEKMNRMFGGRVFGCHSVIQLFVVALSSDAVIFDAGKFSHSARGRPEMFDWKIETDVAVKFAVSGISGVPFVSTPDLAARVGVSGEGCRSRRRITRRVNRAERERFSREQTMSVDNEPAEIRFL